MTSDPTPECVVLDPVPVADARDPDDAQRARLRAMIDRELARFAPPAADQPLTFIDEVQS